ncbi:hypothetical protein Tco_0981769 [Tanacetum coccineum]
MSITKEQQQAHDDALVPREQRLMIGSCNYRLSTTFKPKEPTFQVALDVLSLTPFYQAFLITASIPAIYMHEFWTTASYHKHSIRFKLNTKRYSFDLDTFRNMLQICPKLPGKRLVFKSEQELAEDHITYCSTQDFTKVVIITFMSQDQIISRRKQSDLHMTNDDPILTTMRFIPQHEVVQKYAAILPDNLTTQAMKESEAYKTYLLL